MSSLRDMWKSPAWMFQEKADAIYDLLGTIITSGGVALIEDAETAVVTDTLVVTHTSSGTPAAGFGVGLVFKGEDDLGNGAEEIASIDAVLTTVTATAEDADIVFSIKDDGTVKEVARLVGDTPQLLITTADAATNAVSDMLVLKHSTSGTAAAGLGNGISFTIEDASGNAPQEAASIDAVWTTATHGSEAADMVFKIAQTNGAVTELMRLTAASDTVAISGDLTATKVTAQHKHTNQPLTATTAITVTSGLVTLAHGTVIIAATKAAPAIGDELYIINTSASGTAAHTVTLSGATWDGTNTVATFDAPGEALHVIATATDRFFILENIGTVGLS